MSNNYKYIPINALWNYINSTNSVVSANKYGGSKVFKSSSTNSTENNINDVIEYEYSDNNILDNLKDIQGSCDTCGCINKNNKSDIWGSYERIYGGLPTMMLPGNLIRTDPKYTQEELDGIKPVDHILKLVKTKINEIGKLEDRVFILRAQTGSGKSTGFVVELYDNISKVNTPRKKLICTQPKVLTAQSNVDSILEWNDVLVKGEDIGYMTGSSKWKPKKGIMFSTIGTLTQQLLHWDDEDIMKEYSFILIDEVHERSNDLDFTIYLLKEFLLRNINNKDLPFVFLMSATFDYSDHMDYFNLTLANVIEVGGIAYERKVIWPEFAARDYVKDSAKLAMEIHKNNKNDKENFNDILIFMTGGGDIRKCVQELKNYKDDTVYPMALWSEVVNNQQLGFIAIDWDIEKFRKYVKNPKVMRRIYVANVVAETGLTIPTLKYCIDPGMIMGVMYGPIKDSTLMFTGPNTQSGILQRKGRIGRKFDGVYYPLYTEELFNKLVKITYPDIYKNNINSDIVKLMYLKTNESMEIPRLLTPFPTDSVQKTIRLMKSLGLYKTKLGKLAARICGARIPVESSRLILSSYIYGVSTSDAVELAIIIGQVENRNLILSSRDKSNKGKYSIDDLIKTAIPYIYIQNVSSYMFRLIIADGFIETLLIYNAFKIKAKQLSIPKLKDWCQKNMLNYDTLLYITEVRDTLFNILASMGLPVNTHSTIIKNLEENSFMHYIVKLKRCLYDGYKNNLAIYNPKDGYYHTINGLKFKVPDLYSTKNYQQLNKDGIKMEKKPKYILYNTLVSRFDYKNKNVFSVNVDKVSVLDGFIQIENY